MKSRLLILVGLLLISIGLLPAQVDTRALENYQDRFRDAKPEVKLEILKNADLLTVEELGPLYVQAVQYTLSFSDQLDSDIMLREIAQFAVDKIGQGNYTPGVRPLWSLFTEHEDNLARVGILSVLGKIGHGDAELVRDLNGWVKSRTELYRTGVVPDEQVLRASVETLGRLGDPTSFSMLLDAELTHISDLVSTAARESMWALDTDYVEAAVEAIGQRTISNKIPALEFFLQDVDLSPEDQARLAAGVLSDAARTSVFALTDQADLREVRFIVTRVLMSVPYPSATESLILSFNQTFQAYDHGIITKAWVIDAISALGSAGTERAALRLTTFLDLLNNYTENDRSYDPQIVLSVVTNLERIGSPVAYDALFYTILLDYPKEVIEAARTALNTVRR